MATKNFKKNEPLILKIIYWIAIISLFIHIYGFSIFDNKLDKIFSIIGWGGMSLFFIRLIIFNRKNVND